MYKIKLTTFLLIFIIKSLQTQYIPSIPCPQTFSYVTNSQNGEIEGKVNITSIEIGRENTIWVKLSYPPNTINDHAGRISLTKSNKNVVKDIKNGYPIFYRIIFPTTNPLPTLQEIRFNDITICRNRHPEYDGSDIVLNHVLNVPKSIAAVSDRSSLLRNSGFISLSAQPDNLETKVENFQTNEDYNNCGVSSSLINSIATGQKMKPGTWPWLAAMFMKTRTKKFDYFCGASLISSNAVLTAAHCVIQNERIRRPENLLIGLGLLEIGEWHDPNIYIANVKSIIIHSDFGLTSRMYDADIALILLDKSYSYNYRIRPVCLWGGSSDENQIINEQAYIAGWGVGGVRFGTTNIPNMIETEIISTDKCRRNNIGIQSLISNRNFCAGYLNGRDPCKGDSGNGLMIEKNGTWFIRGIVSGALIESEAKCDPNEYVVYTDVAKFRRWIRAYI